MYGNAYVNRVQSREFNPNPSKGWVQLSRVRLVAPGTGHEHISYLGDNTTMWTRAQIVAWIESGEYGFYTNDGYRKAYVHVRTSSLGTKYVQTYADNVYTDNLLALPRG